MEYNNIYNLDCVDGLKKIKNSSIDLTLTSPPYDNLRSYGSDISELWSSDIWQPVISELYRVTKDGGVVVWVVGDATIKGSESCSSFKQALYFREVGFSLHDTMIYQKENPIPQFKSHRYTSSFEYMFVFSKGKPTRGQLIEVPTKCEGRIDKNFRGQVDKNDNYLGRDVKQVKKTKLKTNIWTFSQNNDIDKSFKHTAQFPSSLARDHILSWSNVGDVVLDPFLGSGTTALIAKECNRKYIGFEINPLYFEKALKRILKNHP